MSSCIFLLRFRFFDSNNFTSVKVSESKLVVILKMDASISKMTGFLTTDRLNNFHLTRPLEDSTLGAIKSIPYLKTSIGGISKATNV